MRRLRNAYRAFDRYQQRHSWLGFPFAVQQKYGDDQGGYLAATLSYYSFFSLFPLLLVGTTLLGFVLENHPSLEKRIIDTALAQFPVIGGELRVGALTGNPVALAFGLVIALWSGTGVFLAAENAMNHVWGVPFRKRLDPFRARANALLLVAIVGSAALCATALSFVGTFGSSYQAFWKAGSLTLSTALAFALFWIGYRTLTIADIGWRETWLGAAVAATLYQLLQALGSYYVEHVLRRASSLYGAFALVIGLLSWIYLGATITLYAAEINVVAFRRLWPRSVSSVIELPATEADERALTQRAEVEERRSDERIGVRWRRRNRREQRHPKGMMPPGQETSRLSDLPATERDRMAIGPVQLIVLGFEHPDFHGEIIEELERLKETDTLRVIDALAVYKDADGELEVEHLSNLSEDEAIELGSAIGALIGLGIEGEEGLEAGAAAGAEAAAEGAHAFSDEEAWDVVEEIPNDSAAALILLEHHWAVPLRDAIARAGGFRISDGFISPLDLVAIGLHTAEEAEQLHQQETAGAASTPTARR